MSPGDLSVVIGANASGKTNLTDMFDFISDVYSHGLPVAVARKGGFENITHRKVRRSRAAIKVAIVLELKNSELYLRTPPRLRSAHPFRCTHSFSFRTKSQAVRADYSIDHESIKIEEFSADKWTTVLSIERDKDGIRKDVFPQFETLDRITPDDNQRTGLERQFRILADLEDSSDGAWFTPSELFLSAASRFVPSFGRVSKLLSDIRVFQVSPTSARNFGVPIPSPEMGRYGDNLPAVVDMIIRNYPKQWASIMSVMREVMPALERIDVSYTHSRTLGLEFFEDGIGRAWSVNEISDGTIHCLALLVALFDPRTSMLILEEPENSVHTWILRSLMRSCVLASKDKQVLLTTHSKVVMDSVRVQDVWLMWRSNGESQLAAIESLDPDVLNLVSEGDMSTFEILDSGMLVQAIPPSAH